MKRAFIFGEFITKSTTGIAYVNTNLKYVLKELNFLVETLDDPRSNDYFKYKGFIKKNYNVIEIFKVILNIVFTKKYNISFLTISLGNLGLLKSLLIIILLKFKTKDLYLYIHRGDLDLNYKKSLYKKYLIKIHLSFSTKIILLSKLFRSDESLKDFQKKILIIPNSLSKEDTSISNDIFKNRYKILEDKYEQKIVKFIYSGNLQAEKGIHKIIEAINLINQKKLKIKVQLDIYGMKFEEIDLKANNIFYKGKLKHSDRLTIMSNYDFLISASKTEGLPITFIECMAIGLPFITTNVGAINDLLINNYPYTIQSETLNIVEVIHKAIDDITKNKSKLKSIILSNHDLFYKKFQYSQFLNSIKKNLKV